MKKRVISWLLCLALCLSMLPMAALAEDVQAPEGPAPSMNEPQPEPRAKENETPAPESGAKIQSELMTAGNLFMPLAEDIPFTISFTATQNGNLITDEKPGVISGGEVTLTVRIQLLDISLRNDIIEAAQQSTLQVDNNNITFAGVGGEDNDTLVITITFAASSESHSVKYLITYNNQETTAERTLQFGVCSHLEAINVNGKVKCNECGAALVAELTAGASSSATYYDTLEEALSAAQTEANSGCTVKLLADRSLLSKYELEKGTFTLDLDGHALTQTGSPMWVSGTANLTVKNNSSNAKNTGRFSLQSETATLSVTKGSKYALLMNNVSRMNVACFLGPDMGYKNANGAWANFGQLNNGAIYDVTVEQAPFTTSDITISPENAYVNRKVTLSVTLSNLETGTTPTCSYFMSDSSNSQTSREGITLDANQAFTVEFTPREKQYYIRAWITADEFTVVKTIKKTFKTCMHRHGEVNQTTGYCKGCDSWMAASVSSTHYVNDRKYYETFDLAMKAALDMLKSKDCWFTMFQNAQVGTIEYQYLDDLNGKTLYMDLNEKTLTSSGVAFRVQGDKWKLDITNGTVIGDTSGYNPVNGVIEVEAGGYLNVRDGTIQNKGANAPSIMVHGYSPSTGAEVRGVANIAGDKKSNFGSLFIIGGNVTVNGGTYDQAKVTNGGSLKVFSGTFQGDVTVDDHALLDVGSTNAYFDGKLTFKSEGRGSLSRGYYKHIETEGATLGKLNNNYAYVFMNGGVYVPDARNLPELTAVDGKYITIESHRHDFSNNGKCWCGAEAEAYLWMNGPQQYGYFDDMLALAEEKDGSCVYLLKDVTIIRDTEVKEGNFSIAGGRFKVTCSGSSALKFSGGTVSIGDGTTNATVTSSSIGSSSLTAGTDYTISAEFEDANAGEGKKVTVKVTLTNPNYCFGYKSDGTPILEKTFETTGTIMQDTTPIEKSEKIEVYSGVAHTYTVDLDACLNNLQDLGFEGYQITEKDIVVSKLIDANQVVLEGHSLKIPVNAVVTAPGTVAAKFTIAVACKNYSNVTILVRVETKDRSTVTATATPSKSKLTYGEKLDTIALSGTTDPMIPGTFAWQTPDAILDAGRHADLVWKFIPADYTYAEASGTAEITVKQAKLTDPAPVTLTIYNGWAGTYEAALPELPALAEGLYFGKNTAYGEPDVSAGEYYSSGAELKTVNGKQGVSIPILKNETAKEGKVGTITVQYTSQNYEPVTLAINLVARNRTAPTFILTADHDTLSGGGKVTLTLERGNLPDGAVVTVSGTDEAGNAVTMTDNGDGTYSATLPNKTQTYTFIAAYDGSQTIAPKTDFTTVKVQQRSSGGGEPAKPSFPVKIANSGDGVAKVDKSYASAGAKVTITVTPGRNATVQRITVTDEDGQRLKLTENRDGTYSFTMPSGTANVYVRFSGSGLPFADVPSGSWYYDDVAYVYDTGLMTGLTVTAFGPNLSTTRGMIVTILWRMENEPAAKHGCPFADVRRGSYYEQAIAWASENGIVTGFDASTFAPDRAITREQLAAILFRFAAYRGMDAVTLRENLSSFQDQAAISAYAVSALNWAVGEGLMQGTGDKLEPTGSATRAQVAAMLRRFMQRNF